MKGWLSAASSNFREGAGDYRALVARDRLGLLDSVRVLEATLEDVLGDVGEPERVDDAVDGTGQSITGHLNDWAQRSSILHRILGRRPGRWLCASARKRYRVINSCVIIVLGHLR